MITVHFDPAELTGADRDDFDRWQKAAEKATAQAVNQARRNEQIEFKSAVWTALKRLLLRIFHDKCAYCESKMSHVSFGSVDHYRPKGAVTGTSHPGYYWLAYHWRNLLPACLPCNSGGGKGARFPTERPHVDDPGLGPELLDDREKPLLLNPVTHHPEEHLRFGVKGKVEAVDDIGKKSIETYGLGREPLEKQREETGRHAIHAAAMVMAFATSDEDVARVEEELARYTSASAEHSAAARAAIETALRRMSRIAAAAADPPPSPPPPPAPRAAGGAARRRQ